VVHDELSYIGNDLRDDDMKGFLFMVFWLLVVPYGITFILIYIEERIK